ncbi:MAG: hypothetical protein HFH79_03060 [Lachnospiraceae bacterium]|jgi:hypothetical protein|nr:hypothetical protein [Lachnospiraceae bacterium]
MNKKLIPKLIAVYLPQFYETEDNNLWWGKGFTDWDSVRTAEKYFEGHNEPRVPLGGKYYDLNTRQAMQRQAELAKKYGIDGFCFYHYYFKDGKKELEIPAENLLQWKDIDMPFCFNWASEPWIRSWSRICGNVWAEKYEKSGTEVRDGVLMEQDYGGYKQWEAHFEYLLPFFQDERYIKLDGKPVFVFYSPNDIQPIREMTVCWRQMAVEAGLPGLHLIGARINAPNDSLDAAMIYEPRNSLNHLNDNGRAEIRNGVRCFRYEEAWQEVLSSEPISGYRTYFCGISGYDDTPRRGKSGECMLDQSPEIFQENFKKLIEKSAAYGNAYLFINAWNEWGEGMYLEPDELYGYAYLKAVKNAISHAVISSKRINATEYAEACKREIARLDYDARKFKRLFQIMDKWLFLEEENRVHFAMFLEMKQVRTVAIYGMSALGKHLLAELRREKVRVCFGIDRYVGQFGDDCKIYRPEETFPDVDAIIITAYDTTAIANILQVKYHGKIFSLEEIIDVMMKE